MKLVVIAPAATLLALAMPLAATAQSLEGFWGSGYRMSTGGSISLSTTVISDNGFLEVEFSNWDGIGYAVCNYAFLHADGEAEKVLLDTSAAASDTCPRDFGVKMVMTSQDTMLQTYPGASFIENAEYTVILRPAAQSDLYDLPEGVDILDVEPRMPVAAAFETLIAQGYERVEDMGTVYSGDTWQRSLIFFGRNRTEDNRWYDLITIAGSGVAKSSDDLGHVLGVGRSWGIRPEDNLAGVALQAALEEKYGPFTGVVGKQAVHDGEGGRADSVETCRLPYHQGSQINLGAPGAVYAHPGCGPVVNVDTMTGSDGFATQLRMTVGDTQAGWQDFWTTWSMDEGARIRALYDNLATPRAAPKL